MAKILVVEDEDVFAELIANLLRKEQHAVDVARDGDAALVLLKLNSYELLILDWNIPGPSGLEVLKTFRGKGGNTPALMLTSKSEINDKETGFAAGSDDYLTKPFNVRELTARVKALLRRSSNLIPSVLQFGALKMNLDSYSVVVNDTTVHLQPREFALLEFLIKHPNQVFSAEALISRVWSYERDISAESVRTFIMRLRKKVEKSDSGIRLRTLHKLGYKLEAAQD
jgi:DNA-binding response OmpR family regulator